MTPPEILQIIGGQVLLPILILLVLLPNEISRPPLFVNFCLTFVVYSIIFTLRYVRKPASQIEVLTSLSWAARIRIIMWVYVQLKLALYTDRYQCRAKTDDIVPHLILKERNSLGSLSRCFLWCSRYGKLYVDLHSIPSKAQRF